jgi:ubiquinone/menaquinone biosynthesis C-methylase UbiE
MSNSALDPLTSEEWATHHNYRDLQGLVKNVRSGAFSAQTKAMLSISGIGKKVLEVGSGSGETSLALQTQGNICTALDFTQSCLDLTKAAANELGLEIQTIYADATKPLPFKENEFDIIFQAGLLEHFERDQRIKLLKTWGKCTKQMVSIIPNSASLAYQLGMAYQKKKGIWQYGLELPQFTLQEEFRAAGFKVTSEYTIAMEAGLTFFPRFSMTKILLKKLFKMIPENNNYHQGYLLVTIGEKIE